MAKKINLPKITPTDRPEVVYPHDGARARVVVREVVTYTVEYDVNPLDYGLAPDDTFTYGELLEADKRDLTDGVSDVFDLERRNGPIFTHVESVDVLSIGMLAEREDLVKIAGY